MNPHPQLFGWPFFLEASSAATSDSALAGLSFGWFDGVVAVLLIIGVMRGRKRGMSTEFLDVTQWLLTVVGGGLTYRPLGQMFAQISGFSLLWAYLSVYLGILVMLKILFYLIKQFVGEKLVSASIFGGLEYYLGMLAGLVRYACMILVVLAVFNVKQVDQAVLKAKIEQQTKDLGKVYAPPIESIKLQVFNGSYSGQFVQQYLPMLLIAPSDTPESAPKENLGQKRQRDLDAVLGK